MREEESNNDDLDSKLRDYFLAEDRELESPSDLWDSISPRLGDQRRPGQIRRLIAMFQLGRSGFSASWPRPFGTPAARNALAVSLVLVVALGLVYLSVSLTKDGEPPPEAAVSRTLPYEEQGEANAVAAGEILATSSPTSVPATGAPAPAGGPVQLVIDVNGDALQFNTGSMSATAGSEVVVTFNNSSSINTHNFVVVQVGTKDAVAADGTAAGPGNNWLPVNDSRVIGSTVLVGPGETGQATFTAPSAGTYQFVCTFPGHNFTMFGDFIVN